MTVFTSSMPFTIGQPVVAPFMLTNPHIADDARRLATAIGRGDESAFRELYDHYHRRLFCLALVLARGDESLAHEAVQSVFITAARKLRRAESEEHLWNWLARVARQHIAKAWRQGQKDSAVVAMAELPECEHAERSDFALEECLDAALLEMDEEDRRLIELFYFDRLSQKQIADQFNVTPKAVSSRLERAREKLKAIIARNLSHET